MTGIILRRYVPGAGIDQRVAMITTTGAPCGAGACATASREFYHADRLGSVIAMASEAGLITARYVYTPFGVETPVSGSANPFRYTGQRADGDSGLMYYRARYYDPASGRFLQLDPVLYADQMNLYAYVGNDPLNLTDPTGLCACCISAGGKLVIRTARYGGNIRRAGRETWGEIRRDAGTAVSGSATGTERAAAIFNLVSPLTTRDIDDIRDWVFNDKADEVGPFEQDDVGKIKGDLPLPGDIADGDLLDAERQLLESLAQRGREQEGHDRGSPNGSREDRENDRQWRNHQDRIDQERDILEQVQDRIDG